MDLNNKKIAIIGDSISTYEGFMPDGWRVYYAGKVLQATGVDSVSKTWWKLLADLLNVSEVRSYSYSGSMVEGAGFPATSSEKRIQTIIDDGYKPDVFIIFMGINDYGWGGSLNQAKGGSEARSFDSPDTFSANYGFVAETGALDKFRIAYSCLIENISKLFPDSRIYCSSLVPANIKGSDSSSFAFNLRGFDFDKYNEAIGIACEESGKATYLPIAEYGLTYETYDGTHPTSLGMQQISDLMYSSISDTPINSEGFKKSEKFCDKCCVGCEFAYSVTKAWHCVCLKEDANVKKIVDDYMRSIK